MYLPCRDIVLVQSYTMLTTTEYLRLARAADQVHVSLRYQKNVDDVKMRHKSDKEIKIIVNL